MAEGMASLYCFPHRQTGSQCGAQCWMTDRYGGGSAWLLGQTKAQIKCLVCCVLCRTHQKDADRHTGFLALPAHVDFLHHACLMAGETRGACKAAAQHAN